MSKSLELFNKKNCIENLSNEIFYEIFDYLDGYDIHQAFSNLNQRFQNLFLHPSYLIKIRFSSTSKFDCHDKKFINSNKYHIVSLHFFDETILDTFITTCMINSSFDHLESLILHEISTFKLLVLLFYLNSLPRLFSLIIHIDTCYYDNLGDIYQTIFHLPYLKYFKISIADYDALNLTIPFIDDKQLSSIKSLSIHHHCTLNELISIISYTPQLSHLHCCKIIESDDDIDPRISIKLTNLIHLKIMMDDVEFDEFERFLLKFCSRLQTLIVAMENSDKSYLDSVRWEKLIKKHMPDLNRFNFCFTEIIDQRFEIGLHHQSINDFTSSFWIDRKWIFQFLIENNELIYLINPYKKTWIDYQEYVDNESFENPYHLVTHLCVRDNLHDEEDEPILYKIDPIFDLIQITSLDIYCDKISVLIFIQLLNCLITNLKSIRISDFPLHNPIDSREPELKIWNNFLEKNKITKLTLRNINGTEKDIIIFIDLFPRIEYLSLQYIRNENIELILRCILLKIKKNHISHPMTICFFGIEIEYDKLEKLKKMIHSRKLLKNYTINRQLDRFYIQWK